MAHFIASGTVANLDFIELKRFTDGKIRFEIARFLCSNSDLYVIYSTY